MGVPNIPTFLDENPNCERTYASFRLAGDGLSAAAVTLRLGLRPDFAAEKGDVRHLRGGETETQPTGVWSIGSKGNLESTSLERHVRFLLDLLEPVSAEVRAAMEEQALAADFFCFWSSATGHGGPVLAPETLCRMGALGASLGIDFYC